MGDRPDATALLRDLADSYDADTFHPDAAVARASLERILATPEPQAAAVPARTRRGRRAAPRRRGMPYRRGAIAVAGRRPLTWVAATAVPAALAVGAAIFLASLGGSQPSLAQAAVIARAAQALQQPDTILYLQVQQYDAHTEICLLYRDCLQSGSPVTQGGISDDPSQDTASYSYQEWLSPDGSQRRTLYSTGDENVSDASSGSYTYSVYDPTDDTATTLTNADVADVPDQGAQYPAVGYFENLYQQALAGKQDLTLVGQTTIDGESVYELQIDVPFVPPADPPAGDLCGGSVCMGPDTTTLLYLDSQTFAPVRSVRMIDNVHDSPGIPPGTSVEDVTDFVAQTLPDTPANEALLAMSAHPGATQVQQTEAQYEAQLKAGLDAQVAANIARGQGNPAATQGGQAATAASRRGHTRAGEPPRAPLSTGR